MINVISKTGLLLLTLNWNISIIRPNGQGIENFGYSTAISGRQILIGTDNGSVQVYEKKESSWSLLQELKVAEEESFGSNIKATSTHALISAPRSRRAYLYQRNGNKWELQKILTAKKPARGFGIGLGLSKKYAVIGNPYGEDEDAWGAPGFSYLYKLDKLKCVNIVCVENLKLKPKEIRGPKHSDTFGYSVAITDQVVVVGAPNATVPGYSNWAHSQGAAYIYKLDQLNCNENLCDENFYLHASVPLNSTDFGKSVSIWDNKVVVSAPSPSYLKFEPGTIYTFDLKNLNFVDDQRSIENQKTDPEQSTTASRFGESIVIKGDSLLVGHPGDSSRLTDAGSASLYRWVGSKWALVDTFETHKPVYQGRFGFSLSLSTSLFVIGSPFEDNEKKESGKVFIYDSI